MTDRNKFEEMLERLVNEDKEGAEALFHEIVVEKSRDIYESLLEDEEVEETTDEEVDEATDEEVDEASDEEVDESEEDLDEATDEEVDESEEEVEENFFGEGDPVDDMMGDIEDPDMGGDEMDMGDDDDMGMGDDEGDLEDKVMDLEAELEALKADFEAMMGDEEPGDEEPGDDMDMDMDMDSEEGDDDEDEMEAFEATDEEVDEATDEEVDEATDEEVEESKAPKSQTEIMREYTDKVSASMGDNGANANSPVAKPNNMGGTTANIVKGGSADEKGTAGGLAQPSTKEDNAGNVNVPGGKASKSMKPQPGHGAEKKGKAPEQDSSAGSPLNGAPKRAK